MTPKEKAEELVLKYYELAKNKYPSTNGIPLTKQCALIAVDEIINSSPSLPILGDSGSYGEDIELSKIYWENVKEEIEKL
jgi:hypothetical protein